jgi:hypothetical protein
LVIAINTIRRSGNGRLALLVETGDDTLRSGEDLGELLRKGTYVVQRDREKWAVVEYTDEK